MSYLDGVLDLVGEVLERAHGDGLLGRIGRGRVRLGLVRQDDLRVGLGAEGARLEERLAVGDALVIGVAAGLEVVQSIAHAVERTPEFLREGFCNNVKKSVSVSRQRGCTGAEQVVVGARTLRLDGDLVGCHMDVRIHDLDRGRGGLRLHFL